MNFKKWVLDVGGKEAAAVLLDVCERTLTSWLSFERAPSIKAAVNIIQRTGGVVDLAGIYGPYIEREHGEGVASMARGGCEACKLLGW